MRKTIAAISYGTSLLEMKGKGHGPSCDSESDEMNLCKRRVKEVWDGALMWYQGGGSAMQFRYSDFDGVFNSFSRKQMSQSEISLQCNVYQSRMRVISHCASISTGSS
jgi:hypothetical protein